MTLRELFLETARFGNPDRMFKWELCAAWRSTLDRWRREGMPADTDIFEHLQMDWHISFLNFQTELGINSGFTESPYQPRFESKIIEENETSVIRQDVSGIWRREWKGYSELSMPQFVRFPVQTRKDYEALRWRLDPQAEGRYPKDWGPVEKRCAERDYPVGMPLCGAFGHLRNLFGVEELLVRYYDEPDFIHDIMEDWVWTNTGIVDTVCAHIELDYVLLWEDMCYKTGPLIGPHTFKEFQLPYYKRVVEHIKSKGVDLVFVDTDGNCEVLFPLFLEVGINGFFPFEVAADMDVVRIREQWGRQFCMFGGLDKRAVAAGGDVMLAEVHRKVPPLLAEGGYFPALDHSAPPDISLADMKAFIQAIREIGDKTFAK